MLFYDEVKTTKAFFYFDNLHKGDQRKPAWRDIEYPVILLWRTGKLRLFTGRTLSQAASQDQSMNGASKTHYCAHSIQAATLMETVRIQ